MRGKNKAVPKYRKHRASGQALVTINGKDFYLGRFGTKASELEYDRLITTWLSSGRRLVDNESLHTITVAEVILLYLKWPGNTTVRTGKLPKPIFHLNRHSACCRNSMVASETTFQIHQHDETRFTGYRVN